MDINEVRTIVTVVSMICFLIIVVRTYDASRRSEFEEASRVLFTHDELPLDEKDEKSE